MNPFAAISLLVIPILITGLFTFSMEIRQVRLRLILAFSAAYLFAISIIHMLPEALVQENSKQTGLFIVIGFCLQLIIDSFSTGIEHGHVHLHSNECHKHLPFGIVIGLCLHSFLEGLPVYSINAPDGTHVNYQLIAGLAVHNFPITIAFVSLLKDHSVKKSRSLLLLFIFSIMAPLGYLFNYALQSFGLSNYATYGNIAYALVIGIFLHISTAILFETGEQHKYTVTKVTVMVLGILTAYLIS
jgi:zinc transporter ZupT